LTPLKELNNNYLQQKGCGQATSVSKGKRKLDEKKARFNKKPSMKQEEKEKRYKAKPLPTPSQEKTNRRNLGSTQSIKIPSSYKRQCKDI